MKTAAIIALGALMQCLRQVDRLAQQGNWDEAEVRPLIDSLFHLDANCAADVYGGVAAIHPGLHGLIRELDGNASDAHLLRMAVTVLQAERKLSRRRGLLDLIAERIRSAERARDAFGLIHDNVIERMSAAYTETLSTLNPRVIVPGQPEQLSQPRNVCRIRALLLAAVRAAVLWRQSGGNGWRLLLHRRRILEQARQLLTG